MFLIRFQFGLDAYFYVFCISISFYDADKKKQPLQTVSNTFSQEALKKNHISPLLLTSTHFVYHFAARNA
jgi:hypothetical protein